jgi:uncharacterized membrane protein YfcA
MDAGYVELLSILFFLALVAGAIDAIAGGGGLIIVPGLLMTGLDPISTFATNKLLSVCATSSASVQFWRRGRLRFKFLPAAAAFGGSICGAVALSYVDPGILKQAVPILLILIALFALFKPALGDVPRKPRVSHILGSLTVIPLVGFYDGFFGPGTGTFFAISNVVFFGLVLQEATIRAKVYNLMSNLGGLMYFIWSGHAPWIYGGVMAVGTLIGGNLGARLILRHGTQLIRPMLVIMSSGMSIKLLWQEGELQRFAPLLDAILQIAYLIKVWAFGLAFG